MLLAISFHPLWCYLFIFVFDLGITGCALSMVVTQFLIGLLLQLYILFRCPYPEAIYLFNKKSFRNWWPYLKLSIPGIFLSCAEMWAYEILIVVSLWCSELDNKVYIMLYNILCVLFSIELGFMYSVLILVGKYIAQNNSFLVKKTMKLSLIYGIIISTIIAIVLISTRKSMLYMYIDDAEIVEKGSEAIIFMAFATITETMQNVFQGICKGLGKQLIASLIVFINFYVFLIGFSILFGKVMGMGVSGIFLGLLCGTTFSCLAYSFVILRFDYDELYKEAIERMEVEKEEVIIENEIVEEKEENDEINTNTNKENNDIKTQSSLCIMQELKN